MAIAFVTELVLVNPKSPQHRTLPLEASAHAL
jgi:hypothetical protein